MSVLIADKGRGLFLGCERTRCCMPIPCRALRPCLPCASKGLLLLACEQNQEVLCLSRADFRERLAMPALPGLCALLPSPCGQYLYELSSEADCIHMRSLQTGELMRGCPVGVYPRDMSMDRTGRRLLVSGGASGELMILDALELRVIQSIGLNGVVCAAAFIRGGAAALVTRENGELETSLEFVYADMVRHETLALFEGVAGSLCALGAMGVALGLQDGVRMLELSTRRLSPLCRELPLPGRLCWQGGRLLISNTLMGQVAQLGVQTPFPYETLYRGDAQAAYV